MRARIEAAAEDSDELAGEMEALSALIAEVSRRGRALASEVRRNLMDAGSLLDHIKDALAPSDVAVTILREESRLSREEAAVSLGIRTRRSLAAHAFYLAQIAETLEKRPGMERTPAANDERLVDTARALVSHHGFRAIDVARSTARILDDQDDGQAAERWEAIFLLVQEFLAEEE